MIKIPCLNVSVTPDGAQTFLKNENGINIPMPVRALILMGAGRHKMREFYGTR